jgi:hypothetical protein
MAESVLGEFLVCLCQIHSLLLLFSLFLFFFFFSFLFLLREDVDINENVKRQNATFENSLMGIW